MKLGILDIGTNSIHMLVVEIGKDFKIEVLDRAKEFTRLGDVTFTSGAIPAQSMKRALTTIGRFKKLAEIRGVNRIKAVATSAVREARNGGELIEQIQKNTGIKVRVITGDEEARLIYLAVKHFVRLDRTPSLIVDIGGGSVELIVANAKGPLSYQSLKLGVVRLKDKFIKRDPPTKKEIKALQTHIDSLLKPALKKIKNYKIKTAIGTSGTIVNLVAMAHALKGEAPLRSINHFRISSKDLRELEEPLLKMDVKERMKLKGLDPQRADIILPGSLVLNGILEKLKIKETMLCDGAIREGMVYDYLEKNKSKIEMEGVIPDLRLRSVMQLARKCDFEEAHSKKVEALALSLFDQTQSLHGLGARERELLSYAALLHDIGYHISYNKHHKHTYYLIRNGDLNGLEDREIECIANIARYHTRSLPVKSHAPWMQLNPSEKKAVSTCGAILRIADALDRSHFSVVQSLKVIKKASSITIAVKAKGDSELEIWAANKRKDLFEKTFGRKLDFEVKRG